MCKMKMKMYLRKSDKTSLSRCGHICTDLGIPIGGEVKEKEELKNLIE